MEPPQHKHLDRRTQGVSRDGGLEGALHLKENISSLENISKSVIHQKHLHLQLFIWSRLFDKRH
jgi:hypothetical protein